MVKFAKHWYERKISVEKNRFGFDGVSVWGASNTSLEDAQSNASERAEKFTIALRSEFTRANEYEYWLGFVREEVLEEIKNGEGGVSAVISRNSYGAAVLNAQNMLIGDIDIDEPSFLSRFLERFGKAKKDKQYFLSQIERYQSQHTDYTIKVYETFAGLRFIVTNQLFSPNDESVSGIFAALGVDKLYRRLCSRQDCFRARLSPKPWRLGMQRPASRYPRVANEQREFEHWLRGYVLASSQANVVNVLRTFGEAATHSDIAPVIAIHDKFTCGVQKPLA